MADLQQYFLNQVFTWSVAIQLAVGGIAFLLAHNAAVALYRWFERHMALSGLSEGSSDLQTLRRQ